MKNDDLAALTNEELEARLLALVQKQKEQRRKIREAAAEAERERVWELLGFPSHQAYLEHLFGEWPRSDWEDEDD